MGKKKAVAFVELPQSLIGPIIQLPVVPEDVRLLFVDWALEQYADWCARNEKKAAIARAEVAFPGPFMRLTANRRSFYFAWDRAHGRGLEISRREYPRAGAISHSITMMPMGAGSGTIGSVRRSLSGQIADVPMN
jgi:hypothetical protein